MLNNTLRRFDVKDNDCWIWNGIIDKDGYGRVKYKGRMEQAHRIIYTETNQINIDSSIHIHHKCTNKACVNPKHMSELVNSQHNTLHKTKIDKALGSKIEELYKSTPAYLIANQLHLSTTTVTSYLKSKGYKMYRSSQKLEKIK